MAGGSIDVYESLMKIIVPGLIVDLATVANNVVRTGNYNPELKVMPLDSFVPAIKMWLKYIREIGVRSELLEVVDNYYNDLMEQNPSLQKEDITILTKYLRKTDGYKQEL